MRSYHIAIASFAAGADAKWTDNLLSHHDIVGVERAARGVTRRISLIGVRHIVLIHRLVRQLSVPVATAVSLAAVAWGDGGGTVAMGEGIELRFDLVALRREIDLAVERAVEMIAPARRGRPPGQRRVT